MKSAIAHQGDARIGMRGARKDTVPIRGANGMIGVTRRTFRDLPSIPVDRGGRTAMRKASIIIGGCLSVCAFGQFGVRVNVRIFLEGCYVAAEVSMHDSLRAQHWLPLDEPYGALGYVHVGDGGTEHTSEGVMGITGADAIVDWVVLELREADANGFRVATRSALLQRDGDVVDMDGVSGVSFNVAAGNYFFSVKHRNHLGVMTSTALSFGPDGTPLDLTLATTPVWGVNARKDIGGKQLLWSGDANGNGQVKYAGSGNDRDAVLVFIGGTQPNATVSGYYRQDVNMDGTVKYTGSGNDRDRILLTVGGATPNAVRTGQVP